MTTATLTFDQPDYNEGDPITFTVEVDAPMDAASREITFTGSVLVPLLGTLPTSGTATVVTPAGEYGPFTADGYTVVQDETDPAVFHATPTT